VHVTFVTSHRGISAFRLSPELCPVSFQSSFPNLGVYRAKARVAPCGFASDCISGIICINLYIYIWYMIYGSNVTVFCIRKTQQQRLLHICFHDLSYGCMPVFWTCVDVRSEVIIEHLQGYRTLLHQWVCLLNLVDGHCNTFDIFLFLAFVCFCDVAVSTTMHTYEHLGERVSNAIPSCHISLPTLVFAPSCWCQWMSPRNGTVQPAQLSGHICASDSGFVQRVMQSSPLQTFLKLEPFEKRCAESAKPLGCHVGRWW